MRQFSTRIPVVRVARKIYDFAVPFTRADDYGLTIAAIAWLSTAIDILFDGISLAYDPKKSPISRTRSFTMIDCEADSISRTIELRDAVMIG